MATKKVSEEVVEVDEKDEMKTYHVGPKGFMREGVPYRPGEAVQMRVEEAEVHQAAECDIREEPWTSEELEEARKAAEEEEDTPEEK